MMPLFRSMGARKDATRGTTALEVRKGLEGLFTGPGVLPGGISPLVQGTAGFSYRVNRAHFVTRRTVGDGFHLFGNDGAVDVPTGVAPGAGLSRIDIIWVRHPSNTENGDTDSVPVFGVTQGTAAALPIAPGVPTGAIELARNTMTSAAGSTSSTGNTITQTAAVSHVTGTGTLTGREAVTQTALVDSGAPLTGVITVPALPVPYRVTLVAQGRAGGAASTRNMAWYFDSTGSLGVQQDSADASNMVQAPASARVSIGVTARIDAPANTPVTFRLMYAGNNNAFNAGAVVWTRTPL